MKPFIFFAIISLFVTCHPLRHQSTPDLPSWIKGQFIDDYGISYSVSDTLFTQHPSALYHIIEWNNAEQYLLVKNDAGNPTEKGLYSRIDYMKFMGMEPFTWGFCLTVYNAPDIASAKKASPAKRTEPKTGCNGFPFSRMKKVSL